MRIIELNYLTRKINVLFFVILGSMAVIISFILLNHNHFILSFFPLIFGIILWLVGIKESFLARDLGRRIRK